VELPKSITYRLALASGFLQEAEQDFALERWRSCVDNAQLAVENAGKVALALFGIVPKTHDPARQIAVILQERDLPVELHQLLHSMLPDLLVLGKEAHFLTDYGDEAGYVLPMSENQPFVHLHCHSEFSLLDGLSRVNDLVQRAVELNQPAIALTDHGAMYGTMPFYRACKRAAASSRSSALKPTWPSAPCRIATPSWTKTLPHAAAGRKPDRLPEPAANCQRLPTGRLLLQTPHRPCLHGPAQRWPHRHHRLHGG
jgi:hypothetical protein